MDTVEEAAFLKALLFLPRVVLPVIFFGFPVFFLFAFLRAAFVPDSLFLEDFGPGFFAPGLFFEPAGRPLFPAPFFFFPPPIAPTIEDILLVIFDLRPLPVAAFDNRLKASIRPCNSFSREEISLRKEFKIFIDIT
ncbi:MAG: hypothetical protein IT223_01350 [Crocinitomicaceae bacterium]|nr:hypothetical protein [Crocinitomicaceae bacterium]